MRWALSVVPTGLLAIFTTHQAGPHLLGPIATEGFDSYMAVLVPVIIPMVVKLFCTKKRADDCYKEQEKLYPSKPR